MNETIKKKIIILLIMTLTLFGCSDNSRNQEIQTVFEKNGFEMTRNTISYKPVTSYVMTNEAVHFDIHLSDGEIKYIQLYDLDKKSNRIPYCVYGKNDDCYGIYLDPENSDSDENKKVLEQSKVMEKEYKAFMKKNKIKKQELVDFFQYYYDENKDEWENND